MVSNQNNSTLPLGFSDSSNPLRLYRLNPYIRHFQHLLRRSETHWSREEGEFRVWLVSMASFTVPCPKCVSPLHLGLNSQNPQRHNQILPFQNGSSLKPAQSLRSSIADPALAGFQVCDCVYFWVLYMNLAMNLEHIVDLFRFWLMLSHYWIILCYVVDSLSAYRNRISNMTKKLRVASKSSFQCFPPFFRKIGKDTILILGFWVFRCREAKLFPFLAYRFIILLSMLTLVILLLSA